MTIIFIDANIYLGFWSIGNGRISGKLLLPLADLKDHIFITQQTVDEINRNKLRVFIESLNFSDWKVPFEFPEHQTKTRETSLVNDRLKASMKESKALKKDWSQACRNIAIEIGLNKDMATGALAVLFSNARKPTCAEMKAARQRREVGNPPGKVADKLGDQISWEQLLNQIDRHKSLYIVTNDKDYFFKIDNELILNPFLRQELLSRGLEEVHIFDNLSKAMDALGKSGLKPESAPDSKTLVRLAKEEELAKYPSPPYGIWPDDVPWKCPRCDHVNYRTGLTAHPSRYGSWSYWARCEKCGYRFDTGEPYDE